MIPHSKRGLIINLLSAGLLGSAALAEEVSVAAFGDSLVQGFGLPAEDGFVPQLQAYLDAAGAGAVLINAGVSGDTSAGGAARLDWTLSEAPDAVILSLGANDALRGLPVDQLRANLDAMLAKLAAREVAVLLVGIDVPGNFGPEYQADFQATYVELAAQYDVLFQPNFMDGLAQIEDVSVVLRDFMQGDGIHPNAAGVALIVEAMGPKVLELIERTGP